METFDRSIFCETISSLHRWAHQPPNARSHPKVSPKSIRILSRLIMNSCYSTSDLPPQNMMNEPLRCTIVFVEVNPTCNHRENRKQKHHERRIWYLLSVVVNCQLKFFDRLLLKPVSFTWIPQLENANSIQKVILPSFYNNHTLR